MLLCNFFVFERETSAEIHFDLSFLSIHRNLQKLGQDHQMDSMLRTAVFISVVENVDRLGCGIIL